MNVFDRYLLRLFLKVLIACMLCITGLYVVVDFCNNMDEFIGYGGEQGYFQVIGQYYAPRVPWFFDRISGLLALIAAMFAITWLQRSNEMTALLAAGVSKARILKPLILAAAAVSLLAAANREFLIPVYRHKLLRNAQGELRKLVAALQVTRRYTLTSDDASLRHSIFTPAGGVAGLRFGVRRRAL